jgi:hypothetical protein
MKRGARSRTESGPRRSVRRLTFDGLLFVAATLAGGCTFSVRHRDQEPFAAITAAGRCPFFTGSAEAVV